MGKFTHVIGKCTHILCKSLPMFVFKQSLHKMCDNWVNLPILWVNLSIRCVVTQSFNKLCNSWENLPIYCVNLYTCHVITQSSHKMCNNRVDLRLCCVNIYPSYTTFQHTRVWNTGTKVCRTRCCARCRIYETPFAWFDVRWNFVTRANKSDSLVTSRLKKEEPDFPFLS